MEDECYEMLRIDGSGESSLNPLFNLKSYHKSRPLCSIGWHYLVDAVYVDPK